MTKVLYIAGCGRSGSTLLELILGSLPGFVPTGELRRIWEAGYRKNVLCGCGSRFEDCPFWREVSARQPAFADRSARRRIEREGRRLVRIRNIPRLARGAHRGDSDERRFYLESLRGLYEAVQAASGGEVVVDSSKSPTYAFLLASIPELDVRFLHLVRDSRGVAYSMSRRKLDPGIPPGQDALMPRTPASRSALDWSLRNALSAGLRWTSRPRALLRYEDLVRSPATTLTRSLHSLELPEAAEEAARLGPIELGQSHSVIGNPVRFHRGPLELRLDDEWKRRMPLRARRLVTLLTSAQLASYGYALGQRN